MKQDATNAVGAKKGGRMVRQGLTELSSSLFRKGIVRREKLVYSVFDSYVIHLCRMEIRKLALPTWIPQHERFLWC